jgi:hypothetical protein
VLAVLAVSAVAAGSVSASPGALRILLVEAQCDLNTPSATLRNQLVAQPEVAAVDFFNGAAGTPSVGQLTPYDVVMAMGDCGWLDRIALGNNLADYQDQAGVVIGATFNWQGTGASTIGGRWTDAGYNPYQLGALDQPGTSSLGSHDSASPLLAGVTSLSAQYRSAVALTPGTSEIARWSDDALAVAFKGRAIGINANIGDYSGTNIFGGDFARIFVNAGRAYVPGDLALAARKATVRGKALSVPVSCATGSDCVGAIALDATAPKKTGAASAKRARRVHLGDATLSVTGGQTTTVAVTLTKRARKQLRERGKLAATVGLTTRPAIAGAADRVTTAKLKVRAAKRKKR